MIGPLIIITGGNFVCFLIEIDDHSRGIELDIDFKAIGNGMDAFCTITPKWTVNDDTASH